MDYKFPKIIGINQLADETALVFGERKEQMFVREAENVDIDSTGDVSRRQGYTQLLSGAGYHSLYKTQRGWLMLCRRDELGVYDNGFVPLASMGTPQMVSFTEENGNLYAMNSGFAAMFKPADLVAYPIGVPLPAVTPQFVASTAGGSLLPGEYGVTYSLVDPSGEESGLGPVVQMSLSAQGRIDATLFTVLPGYKYRIYMTTTNGQELYQAAEFDAVVVSFSVLEHEMGRPPATFGLEPAPKGHIVRAFKARLLIGTTDFVYFTEAFRPHLHNSVHGFVATSGFTTMIEPLATGVFIADKRGVRFYTGEDPTAWQVREVTSEPVVFNTSVVVPGTFFTGSLAQFSEVAMWLSVSGYQVGTPQGEVVRVNAGQVRLPSYVQGATVYGVREGRKQVVTAVNSNVLASASVALDSI